MKVVTVERSASMEQVVQTIENSSWFSAKYLGKQAIQMLHQGGTSLYRTDPGEVKDLIPTQTVLQTGDGTSDVVKLFLYRPGVGQKSLLGPSMTLICE